MPPCLACVHRSTSVSVSLLDSCQRAAKGGGKLRGVENIPQIRQKNPPQTRFWTPHLRYVSPPLLFWRLSVISLKRKRHRPDQPQFLRPPKVVLESPQFMRYVLPPPQPLPNLEPDIKQAVVGCSLEREIVGGPSEEVPSLIKIACAQCPKDPAVLKNTTS